MAAHYWNDPSEPDFDWAGVSAAAEYIGTRLIKWGRVNVRQWKEKFGGVRVYCSLGFVDWQQITHPGHAFIRWPSWLYWGLFEHLHWLQWLVNLLVLPYHRWLYARIYRLAVEKWPHLREEILEPADHEEFLQPLLPRCAHCEKPISNWTPPAPWACSGPHYIPPRYDEVYAAGTEWLDAQASPPERSEG